VGLAHSWQPARSHWSRRPAVQPVALPGLPGPGPGRAGAAGGLHAAVGAARPAPSPGHPPPGPPRASGEAAEPPGPGCPPSEPGHRSELRCPLSWAEPLVLLRASEPRGAQTSIGGAGVPAAGLLWRWGSPEMLRARGAASPPGGPFCRATLDGIPTQGVAATACPGPPGAGRAAGGPETPHPSAGDRLGTSADRFCLQDRLGGSRLHLLPIPGRYLQGARSPWGMASPGFAPRPLPTCPCWRVHRHTPIPSPLLLLFLPTDIKASPASLPCTEELPKGIFSPLGFSRPALRRGIPVACWSVGAQSVPAIRDPCRTRTAGPPAGSGAVRRETCFSSPS